MPALVSDALVFGRFRLEPDGRLSRDGKPVALSPKETALLQLLACAEGRTVSKSEILDRIWATEAVSEASLTRCVHSLRAALGDQGRRGGCIETVHGRGYRLSRAVQHALPTGSGRNVRIAVVPFDLEETKSPEYLGVGLAADVTTRLGLLGEGGIAPLARQSARRLRSEHGDPLPLARELALDFLVTGRMRAKNGELRVVVEVVQVSDQSLLWSEAFSSSEDGAEILAGTIAEALASRFGRPAPMAPEAVDPRAYRALLQGEFLSQTRSERGIRQSIGCFQKALEWEPEWAHAHAALAHAFLYLGLRGYARPLDVAPSARAAAARAMQCSHGSVSALRSLAHLRWALDWLPDEALELLARAERLAPHDDQVTHLRGGILGALGRFEEALAVLERARATNPFAPNHVVTRINTLVFAGRIEEASLEARQLADVQPELAGAHALRAVTAVLAARPDDAVGAAEITDRLARSDQLARSAAGWALARCGRESASRAILAAFERSGARRYVGMSFPAAVHVGLGEHAAALACLERAVEERCMWLPYVGVDPRFAPLRDDARFREIAARATGGHLRLS